MQLGERGGGGASSTPLCTGDHVPVPDEKLDSERRGSVAALSACSRQVSRSTSLCPQAREVKPQALTLPGKRGGAGAK